MSLYQFIATQLDQAGLHYEEGQLKQTDIIEYMVLEAAGALHPLQGRPLKCVFRAGHTSNILFKDDKKRSALEFGLKGVSYDFVDGPSISREEHTRFNRIVNAIEDKFSDSTYDSEHQFYNDFQTLYAIILADEEIKEAIQSSSLFVAAGDLSAFNLEQLLLLRKKLNLYKIADDNLSKLVDRLIERVNAYLSEHFNPLLIQQALPQIETKFAALLVIANEEHKFNQLLRELNYKLYELIHKGMETYKTHPLHSPSEEIEFRNKKYDPNYLNVASIARILRSTLVKARDNFFNNPISPKGFEEFRKTCLEAISQSKDEFANYRGQASWYNDLNPILKALITCIKAIGGIIAGLTVVPAVLTEVYSEQGYIGTFFSTKTSSSRKLERFEQGLCAGDGIFEQLEEALPSACMTI